MNASAASQAWSEARTHFMSRAIQYYIAGRFAALAQQFPACGNILHHAVEMAIKASLAIQLPRGDIAKFRHDLKKMWRAFKVHYPDARLTRLDTPIAHLHKFERLRCPDEVMVSGMHGTFALERAHVMDIKSFEAHTPPHYDLVLEDVDELFYLIFNVTRMNPNFYLGGLHPSAINVLNDKNLHPFPPAP